MIRTPVGPSGACREVRTCCRFKENDKRVRPIFWKLQSKTCREFELYSPVRDGEESSPQPDSQEVAQAIEADFRALIDKLDEHIGLLTASNSEALVHLARTKSIAERGLRLSERLANASKKGS